MKRAVVVGGGIAGLAAAWELHRAGARVTLLEARPRLGGVIVTKRAGGWILEGGPDSFLTTKPGAVELCREAGLSERIIPARSRRVHVLSGGILHPVPDGVHLTVPTRSWPLLRSRLFTWRGKFRMLSERWRKPAPPADDESLGAFVRRRFGDEAFEKLAEPLMAGIHLAPGDALSLKSTFPRFLEMEREQGSLIRALRRGPPAGTVSPFVSLKGGMEDLVDRLVERMPEVEFRTSAAVRRIERGYRLVLDGGAIAADVVVLAVPAPAAAELVRPLDEGLAEALRAIDYVGSATVSLGYPRASVPGELDGTGFVIPRAEVRHLLACTWSSSKFEGRAPEGRVLFRCFIPPEGLKGPDAELVGRARAELERVMGITGEPEVAEAWRWEGANPVYAVGHEARVRNIEARRTSLPNLFFTGAGYRGLGIPDCISDGRAIGRAALRSLSP
ncbi:MAG TPA: protoporphyrinogen oxidase [Planctomycetota bacterium]|nr:protoporphyrinogen oxidase [Planctomycetota bacterium]